MIEKLFDLIKDKENKENLLQDKAVNSSHTSVRKTGIDNEG